jgi:hypothetical protein
LEENKTSIEQKCLIEVIGDLLFIIRKERLAPANALRYALCALRFALCAMHFTDNH